MQRWRHPAGDSVNREMADGGATRNTEPPRASCLPAASLPRLELLRLLGGEGARWLCERPAGRRLWLPAAGRHVFSRRHEAVSFLGWPPTSRRFVSSRARSPSGRTWLLSVAWLLPVARSLASAGWWCERSSQPGSTK